MRNGERQSGELVDLGGIGFTLRVGGHDRQIQVNDVAAVEFQGGVASSAVQSKVSAGTHPLRITIDTPSGRRDYTSNDVAGIYYGGASTSGPVATSGQAAVAGTNAGTFATGPGHQHQP